MHHFHHFPWDNGALEFLGDLIGQKTIKAKCKRRVRFADAKTGEHVDCPECRAEIQRELEAQIAMQPEYEKYGIEGSQRAIDELRAALAR